MAQIDLIVPVYNRAHCLLRLLEDLKKQTFSDFSVIFVDDGSSDGSVPLLEKTLPQMPFSARVISQKNGGPAKARNTGIEAASADWIVFADSDDGLQPQYLEYLHAAAMQADADLAFCRYRFIPEDQRETIPAEIIAPFSFDAVSPAECMKAHCTGWLGICGMIVRRTFFAETGIRMDSDCRYMEDAPFLCELIAAASRVAMLEHRLYLYYTHVGSISRAPDVSKFRDGIDCFRRTEERIALLDTEASRVFGEVGPVRYGIATLRKAAVQMPYGEFCQVSAMVEFRRFRLQVKKLARGPRLAARMMLLSKRLFYFGVKILFKD